MRNIVLILCVALAIGGCTKSNNGKPPGSGPFNYVSASIDSVTYIGGTVYGVFSTPIIKVTFSAPINQATVSNAVALTWQSGQVAVNYSYPNDSSLVIQPVNPLKALTNYFLKIYPSLKSTSDSALTSTVNIQFLTTFDTTDKFPRISDSALLTLVEQQTFDYFWTFGHATSGMARERSSSGETVTTGGSGFGVMAMLVGVQRNFITRAEALDRITEEVNFLTNNVTRYHGAFPHWLNGTTGATIPFGTQDDGGDIVETSYMIQGLLCARQFFNSSTDPNEINLRASINSLYAGIEWNWYRQNGQNVLYWNWSPDFNWAIDVQVGGWCEAMITYVLAASSPVANNVIPNIVYTNGWAHNGGERNGRAFEGITLPLGPDYGGPLFFAHYSFLGINPAGLSDAYANYWTQDTAHARINYLYCVRNPGHYNAYGPNCWGLTASDDNSGYDAHSPTNDDGVIAPTAAISSLPYTPTESMNAIRFFYYKLGDKIWGQYGFIDAFNLSNVWFDSDCLAIDQGPEIVMIENYRSGLLWNLFMSCPEVKQGLTNLGFQGPGL